MFTALLLLVCASVFAAPLSGGSFSWVTPQKKNVVSEPAEPEMFLPETGKQEVLLPFETVVSEAEATVGFGYPEHVAEQASSEDVMEDITQEESGPVEDAPPEPEAPEEPEAMKDAEPEPVEEQLPAEEQSVAEEPGNEEVPEPEEETDEEPVLGKILGKKLGMFLNLSPMENSWFSSPSDGLESKFALGIGLDMTFTSPLMLGVRLDYDFVEYNDKPALEVYRAGIMAGYERVDDLAIRADLFYGIAVLECNSVVSVCQAFGCGVKMGCTVDRVSFAVGFEMTFIPQKGRENYMMTIASPYVSVGGWL